MNKLKNLARRFSKDTDWLLLGLCIIASAFGCLAVYSATTIDIAEGAAYSRDFRTMVLAVAMGLVGALIISFIDYELIIKAWPAIAAFCVLIMAATFIWGVGPASRSDVKTWLVLGNTGLYFQPSELVKIGFIITFGMHIDIVRDKINRPLTLAMLAIHALIPTALVVITGDLGSALIFLIIIIAMMFMGGLSLKYFIAAAVAVAAATPIAWKYLLKGLQKDRFLALIRPEEYPDVIYQQQQGITAIGAGKFSGMGFLNGTYTQSGIVPENENDMIFSQIAEEFGFIGCLVALGILTLIIIKLFHTAKTSRDSAAALMCNGLAAMIAGHVIVNIGMCLMLLPVVGITLPFFSAGGSSNLCLYVGIGLALSIFRYSRERDAVSFNLSKIRTPFTE